MLKMQGYYLCNIQVENVVVKTCSWAGLGDNAPHILSAIVSNILLATIYFIIIFLSFYLSNFFCWFREL